MKQFVLRKTQAYKNQPKAPHPPITYCTRSPGLIPNEEYIDRMNWDEGRFDAYSLDKTVVVFDDTEETRDILGWLRCSAANSENQFWEKRTYDLLPVDHEFHLTILD